MPLSVDKEVVDRLRGDSELVNLMKGGESISDEVASRRIAFGRFREDVGPPIMKLVWDGQGSVYFTGRAPSERSGDVEENILLIMVADKSYDKSTAIKDRIRKVLNKWYPDQQPGYSGQINSVWFAGEEGDEGQELKVEMEVWSVYYRVVWKNR